MALIYYRLPDVVKRVIGKVMGDSKGIKDKFNCVKEKIDMPYSEELSKDYVVPNVSFTKLASWERQRPYKDLIPSTKLSKLPSNSF